VVVLVIFVFGWGMLVGWVFVVCCLGFVWGCCFLWGRCFCVSSGGGVGFGVCVVVWVGCGGFCDLGGLVCFGVMVVGC